MSDLRAFKPPQTGYHAHHFIALSALFYVSSFQHRKKRQGIMPWRVAPQVRLELTTLRLTAECSAIELLRIIRGLFAARLPADGSLFCFQLALALSLGHRLGFAARPASARCPVLPYVREREKLPFLPLPVDPGNFLLSQAVPSSVPSAFGGLTSVFGMGTGGALQLSSPETFPGALSRFLSASLFASASRTLRFPRSPSPHLQNCTGQS